VRVSDRFYPRSAKPIFADLNFTDAWNKLAGQKGIFIHMLARTRAISRGSCMTPWRITELRNSTIHEF
jgi:hypothetical protein